MEIAFSRFINEMVCVYFAAPLKFMDTKPEQTGKEGDDVTLRCEVESGKATWSIDGNDPTGIYLFIQGFSVYLQFFL